MTDANLFQLGIGLETGAHEEDTARGHTACMHTTDSVDIFDEDREDHFIRRDGSVFAGTHLIIEVVNGHGLDDEMRIQQAFRDCVDTCGATLLHIHTHKFSPQGVSGVAVLAESHISVHTWPEIGYGAFDVFMCGDAQPWRAVDVLKTAFATADVRVRELRRGEGLVDSSAEAPEVAA
ncbi:MAG: adenosylmethionine decarboxylase [Rhodobacteraceae bacterium]|nr:adenosylmethionine decarboxylase [Paracoccaceae bacterium]MAY47996.1 adenosylmethionine decarboxylase [Paracoccaceae bacterium]